MLCPAGFIFAGLAYTPHLDGSASVASTWARILAGILGGALGFSALYALIRNYQSGCRVHVTEQRLYWWAGYPPLREDSLNLAQVVRIEICDEDHFPVRLHQEGGAVTRLSPEHLPTACGHWARSVQKYFPHIQVQCL